MLQLRPTFSESWYRVVGLKPRLRGTAQISRQYYRGERWYVVRDAASNQFHRLSDAAYRFVGLLDGSRTVGEAWDLVGGTLADDAPTQPEVIQILSQLYSANLVETDIPPDATVLLRRHKKQQQRKLQGRLMNVLFPRIPIWDCDRFVCRWMPLARIAFSKIGAIVWIITVITALSLIAPQWERLMAQAREAMNIRAHPQTFLWGIIVFWGIKFLHECGHAFSCRRFGGEVHEMGIMFLVFMPTPYVDASTAWSFPNKWARMFVGAAGMIVELYVASLCALLWVMVTPNSFPSDLLCYAMIIASMTTVIFNANPLLRYDGYYILSDYLEIPNLQMRSREYLLGLIKRHVFRIKPQQPLPPPGQRVLLGFYGLFSSIYRIFVGVMIVLVVTWQVPVLGVLMALGGVVTWLIVPVVRLFKYLTIDPELHRKRGRAWAFSAAVAALVVFLLGWLPVQRSISAEGVVWPEQRQMLYTAWPGWIKEVKVRDGDQLTKGQVILVAEDPDLDVRIKRIEAQIEQINARMRQANGALGPADQAQLQSDQIILANTQSQLADMLKRREELTLRAGFDGQLVAPEIHNLQNQYLERGIKIGKLENLETLLVRANISQADLSFDPKTDLTDAKTEIQLVSAPDLILHAKDALVLPASQDNLVDRRVTSNVSGDFAIDPRDPSGTKAQVPQFELRATLVNKDGYYYPGQGANVRVILDKEPIYKRCRDRIYQLINTRSTNKWM